MKQHTSQLDMAMRGHRQIRGKKIADLIGPKLLDKGRLIRPCDMVKDLKRDYGLNILYTKAWRAKELAQRNILGDAETSYQLLPSYLHMLQKENPGSIVNLKIDPGDRYDVFFLFFVFPFNKLTLIFLKIKTGSNTCSWHLAHA